MTARVRTGKPHLLKTHQGCSFRDRWVGSTRRLSEKVSPILRDTPRLPGHQHCKEFQDVVNVVADGRHLRSESESGYH